MKDLQLLRHQEVLFELLEAFDEVCKKHHIPYMLFAGTALGAVRHEGFIPWDDDLDVVMLRPDYERFLEIAPGELDPKKYFLQKEFKKEFPMFFSKLRKNNTTCLERYIPKNMDAHRGIYIDIFPCDNLAKGKLGRKIQFYASKIVIAKSLDGRGYWTDSKAKKLITGLCRLLPWEPFRTLVKLPKKGNSACVHTFLGGGARFEKNMYPREWFTESVDLPFMGKPFPVSAHYDALLTAIYGDYMTLPPEEDRGCKVHAELVDPDKSYTEYQDWYRTAKFSEYSRSIR